MSYSRRQLYALGEPLGESVTRLKPGGRIYGGGGGGGSSTQTQTTDLPDWAKPYAKDILYQGSLITDINKNPYKAYGGERTAGFTDLQRGAMEGARTMEPSSQLGMATGLAGIAGQRALGTNYQPGQFSMERAQAPSLQNYQMRGPKDVQSQQFGQQAAEQYMSPYMQSVVDIQQREAQRQGDIAKTQRGAQAAGAGAFGGSRQAIMEAEAARNLAQQKGDIQAQGLQSAFGQAQQQYNVDQAQRMQAALANQGMGYNVGAQNLAANLGVQQLGAGQNLQAQLANQAANQQMQQLREQSRQFGAGLNLQGLQTALQSAGQLGNLGAQQFQQRMDVNKLQSAYGGMEQALNQRGMDVKYQDFLNQQNYPYKQLGFQSDLLRGTPTGSSSVTQMYQPEGSALGQLAGLGTGIYGLSKFMAEGGEVKSYAGDEGSVTSEGNVESIIEKLSDQQLQVAFQNAQARNDMSTMQAIQQELAMRASEKQGMAGAFNMLPQASQEDVVQAAGGGIIAFADRGAVQDPNELTEQDYQLLRPEGAATLKSLKDFFTPEAARLNREKYEAAAAKQKEASKPAPVAKPQPKGAGARSTPAAIAPDVAPPAPAPVKEKSVERRYEELADAPKPTKAQLKSAVNELAEKANLSPDVKDDLMKTAKQIRDELSKENAPMLDELRKAIEAQKPDTEGMRNRGIGQALADFGFKFAAEASKPGARFLGSAAAASPSLSAAAAKMQELETSANQNFAKLKLDQTKYEVALKKGDMQAASTLAAQIRQGQQQDKAFQLQLAKAQDDAQLEREKMAMTGSYYRSITSRQPENVMSLAKNLMQDPTFKGTQNDAIEKAAYLLKGGVSAGIRSDTASAANLDKALKDISTKYPLLKIMKPSDPEYASMKAAYDADVRAAYARHGGAGISDALPSSNATNMAAKGFKNLGAE